MEGGSLAALAFPGLDCFANAPLYGAKVHRRRRSVGQPPLDLRLEGVRAGLEILVPLLERMQGLADDLVRRAVTPAFQLLLDQPFEVLREMYVHPLSPSPVLDRAHQRAPLSSYPTPRARAAPKRGRSGGG